MQTQVKRLWSQALPGTECVGFMTLYYWYPGPVFYYFLWGSSAEFFIVVPAWGDDTDFGLRYTEMGASLVAQKVKSLCAVQETQVRSLGQEDPLETGMVTHSSILAWRVPWRQEPGRLQPTGSQSRTRLSD